VLRVVMFVFIGSSALVAFQYPSPAEARNTPCSGSKGGVKACQGDKFLCNDGSTSASKQSCARSGAGVSGTSDGDGTGASGAGGGKGKGRRR